MTSLSMAGIDRIVGAGVALFGVAVLVAARTLSYDGPFGPGPGFLPRWLGASLVALGALLVLTRLRRQEEITPLELPDRRGFVRVALAAAAILAVGVLLERLGFLLTTALLVLFAVWGLERRPLLVAVLSAVLVPLLFYGVFAIWLGVSLPRGPFGR